MERGRKRYWEGKWYLQERKTYACVLTMYSMTFIITKIFHLNIFAGTIISIVLYLEKRLRRKIAVLVCRTTLIQTRITSPISFFSPLYVLCIARRYMFYYKKEHYTVLMWFWDQLRFGFFKLLESTPKNNIKY